MMNQIHNFLENYQLDSPQPDLFGSTFSHPTKIFFSPNSDKKISNFQNEFWTAKQRKSCSLHEISYRACFKAELPSFFINLLTKENDVVYDPFSGRGTTAIEAALQKRQIISNDVNPLSQIFAEARLEIPNIQDVVRRLEGIKISKKFSAGIDLSMFFEKETLHEILSLKNYLQKKRDSKSEDGVDRWIRMVATNRLTGHSSGFFSVYTLPPNQATSPENQIRINKKRSQIPEYRNVRNIILRKSEQLLKKLSEQQAKNMSELSKDSLFL